MPRGICSCKLLRKARFARDEKRLFRSGLRRMHVGLSFGRGNDAGTVQQILSIRQIISSFIDFVREDDKTLRPIHSGQPDNHEGTIAHVSRSRRESLCQQCEGVVRTKVLATHPHCHVPVAREWGIESGPPVPNTLLIPVQCLPNIRTDTRNVNMQLVLRTARSRVNCQADIISRNRLVQRLVDMSSNLPGVGKIVW